MGETLLAGAVGVYAQRFPLDQARTCRQFLNAVDAKTLLYFILCKKCLKSSDMEGLESLLGHCK